MAPCGTMMLKLPEAMSFAFAEAEAAGARGEVPVGAVVSNGAGTILARAGNRVASRQRKNRHAQQSNQQRFHLRILSVCRGATPNPH